MKIEITGIELLLDKLDRVKKGNEAMIIGGHAYLTDAGSRYFLQLYNEQMDCYEQLSQYPYQWVNAVKLILNLRTQ